jgi:murein DD-endopeptidase MepM/ murein hydrolase activator NlpD
MRRMPEHTNPQAVLALRRRNVSLAASVALAILAVAPARTEEPGRDVATSPPFRFELPVACEMGIDCFVQNHVDRDPGPAAKDYNCGDLTYDAHNGTDIRVRDYVAMERGVSVIAAAPGRVRRLRDGEPDVNLRVIGAEAVKGRESGNFVVIDHGGGWATIYGHLKKGSVAVRVGQEVAAGAHLGLIGLSGKTEFPHVHFGVHFGREPVDPFVGRREWTGCGLGPDPLWGTAALAALAYRPTGILGSGFSAAKPEAEAARRGEHRAERLARDAAAIVFWTDVFGIHEGDVTTARIVGPDGKSITQRSVRMPKRYALWFSSFGRKRTEPAWPPGRYRGEFRLIRVVDGRQTIVANATREVVVE